MHGTDLMDRYGRVVIVHGVNSVAKTEPFISTATSGLTGAARAYLVGNGFNAVRLGVSYAALMPEPGVVDQAYLDEVVHSVDLLSRDGLWVQLDFHQDVFWMMPDWATPADARSLSATPASWLSFIGWAAQYMSPRSLRQWEAFLSGERFVEGRSVAAWLGDAAAALATRVADRDRVIGIELLNEPFSGDAVVRCILEGCGDRDHQLADRYSEMIAPIRRAAPAMPIWMEPFAPTGYAAAGSIPRPQLADTTDPQLGVAWHLYCYGTDRSDVKPPSDVERTLCQQRFEHGFDNGAMIGRDLGGPRMVNEFGASHDPLDATIVTRTADEQMISWMYWHMPATFDGLDSGIPDVVESQIIRPYPQATAGRPESLRFDPATGAYRFRYVPDPTIDAPTSIAIPARQYTNGYDVTVVGGTVTSPPQSGVLTVRAVAGATEVDVVVTRRPA